MADLSVGLTHELNHHFDFEEAELFAILADAGEESIATHLAEEHVVIRPLASALVELAERGARAGFRCRALGRVPPARSRTSTPRWCRTPRRKRVALLPVLDENMDAETEARLYENYVGNA